MVNKITEYYTEEEFMKADGFDEAIIGVREDNMTIVYSIPKCIKILEESMSEEDAIEYFYFNVISAYMGEKKPLFINDEF